MDFSQKNKKISYGNAAINRGGFFQLPGAGPFFSRNMIPLFTMATSGSPEDFPGNPSPVDGAENPSENGDLIFEELGKT